MVTRLTANVLLSPSRPIFARPVEAVEVAQVHLEADEPLSNDHGPGESVDCARA